MTEQSKHSIGWVTFLLAWIAGFCDTATFVAGDGIFSAHVTGNFIVFAAQLASGAGQAASWVKLITFPVFVTAVIAGGWFAERTQSKYKLLLVQGIILIATGLGAVILSAAPGADNTLSTYVIVMVTVFAMGLQNTFGKLFGKETHGPTTMMTGNVTQISLDLGILLRRGRRGNEATGISFSKQSVTIGGFLAGCICGAIFAKWFGLSTIILPGVAIVLCYLRGESTSTSE